jgi:regulation of enolase protein 1 (concanavalin A-like superfamily)
MFENCQWENTPDDWEENRNGLAVVTLSGSDFWRETHYGFTRNSGHFYGAPIDGGFTASLRVRASYRNLYDQAGLMVRLDEMNWVKIGIEFSDGKAHLSTVLTVGKSDWAIGAFPGNPEDVRFRVTIAKGVMRVQASGDGHTWPLVRLSPFPDAPKYKVGPMCCGPETGGLKVLFSEFTIGPPSEKDLHDLS